MNLYQNDDDIAFEAEHAAEVSSAIAEALAALPVDMEESEYSTAVDAVPTEGEPVVTEGEAVETSPDDPVDEVAAPPVKEDPSARGMLRLQEKEAALRTEREAFETEKAGYSKKLADYEAKLAAVDKAPRGLDDKALKDAMAKPLDFLKSKGMDPLQVARVIVAQHMVAQGGQVPPALQDEIYKAQQAAELADLRAELARDREALAKDRTRIESREYARTQGTSKYPALAAMAKVDADLVSDEVVALTDSGLSKEEACEKLNAKWEKFQKAFGTPTSTQEINAPAESASKGAKATVNKKAKAPPRALPYWETDDRDAEVRAALAEATAIAKGRPART